MAFLIKKNNVFSRINMIGGLEQSATLLTVEDGSIFPEQGDFLITIWNKNSYPNPSDDSNMEIVRATSRSGNDITIERAQEGTSDVAHANSNAVEMLITAGVFNEALDQNLKTTDSPFFRSVFIDDGIDSDSEEITQEKVGNWNTAFGWGDHATEGYLTEETDPVFSVWSYKSIVESESSNWTTAYNWGDHSAQGYIKDLTGFSSDDLDEGLLNKYDKIVSLTAGLNITIEGSYPNFTITASGTGGTTNHSELNELLWSESGHSIDSDVYMDSNRIIFSVRASSSTPPIGQLYLYAKESTDSNTPSRLYYIGDDGSEIEVGSGGGEGQVSSVFGRIGAIFAQQNDYTWAQIDKTVSDIADIATRSHTSLSDIGTTTHDDIDIHIGSSSNPHSVTAAQVSAVALTGSETIQGLKTFETLPQSSDIPSEDSDLVTKSYVDSFSQGLLPKDSCIAATTENITLANEQTIDGIDVVAGNRVLVKEQSSSAQNGIYIVVNAGAWTRATDYDSDEEVREGTYTYIINGDTLQNTQWVQYQINPVINVDALNFRPLPAPTEYFASNGLTLSENNFKLGGQISENTEIVFNSYNLNFNLNSTGIFNIQDTGVNRFQVNADGLVGMGSSALAGSQVYILPNSSSLKGLTIRQASGQTAYLMDWQNSSGTVLGRIDEEGFLRVEQTVDQTTKNSGHFYQIPRTLKSYTSGTNDIVQSTAWVAFKLDLSSESSTSYIRSIAVRPKVDVAVSNPTATLTMYLYTDVDNTPGTSLATGTAYRMGQITTAYSTRYWNLTYDAAPAVYWIILRWSAAPGGATLSYQGNASISGECQTSSNGTTWTGTDEGRPRYYLYGRTGTAVYGRSDSGTGVYGYSINGYALYGISENGNAIYGSASRGYGGYFISTYSYGVYANSTYGTAVYGTTTSGSGIYGTSSTGTGVYGATTSGTAIYGISTTGTGIYATTDTGVGIYVACNNAVGNASQQMMRLRRLTSSTPEDGLASHITWELENSNNSAVEASRWSVTAQNVGASVFSSTVSFMSRVNNVLATRLQINELGYTEIVGNNTGAANNVVLRFKDTDTTSQENQNIGRIEFYSSDASAPTAGVKAYIAGVSEGTAPGAYLTFATDQVTGTPTERMRIKSDGTITINKYTENGFVKTSDSNGTLIIDQNVYLTPSDALLLDQSGLSEPQIISGGSPFFSNGIIANGISNSSSGEEEEGILNSSLMLWGNTDDLEEKRLIQIYDVNENTFLSAAISGELIAANIIASTGYTFIGDITCTDLGETGVYGKITAREFVGDATLDYANIETLYGQTVFSHSLAGENITGGSIWQKLGNEFTFKDLSPANPGRCMDMHESLLFLGTYQDKVNNTATVIIYDVTDRLNPVRLSPTDIAGLPQGSIGCKSIKYYDGYLYCSWDGNNYNTLRIIDISDPENPIVVAGEELDLGTAGGGSSVDIDEVNDILYIGCQTEVFKIDISDPTTPIILDSISGLMTHGTLWTCKYSNGYVYTTGRSSADPAEQTQLYVIDVSGSEMVLIENSNQLYFNGTWAIYVEDDYIYMANGLSFINDDNNKFAIVDISDPENPVLVSELFLSESPCSYVRKVGDIVYVSNWALVSPPDYNPAIFAINVADPENPYVVGQTTAPDMPLSLYPADGGQYLYIAFAPFSREVPFFGVMESKGMYAHYGAFSRLNVGTESAIEYSFPEIDGTAGQVLCTDGEGVVSWGNYFKLDQTTPQDVVPLAGTTFSLTTFDALPNLAPGALTVPAIAFTSSDVIGFNPYIGAIRAGLLTYAYDGNEPVVGLIQDTEADQLAIFSYDSTNSWLDLEINGKSALHNFSVAENEVSETWYPVLGGKDSDGNNALFFDTLLAIWDSQGSGNVGICGVSQDFSATSLILSWNSDTETLSYSGEGGMVINTTGWTEGTTSTPLTLAFGALGDGHDDDGLRLAFEHRSDAGLIGTGYTAGYIDCIQTDASATEMDSYLAFGGYTAGASSEWLRMTGTLGTFSTDLKVVTGTNTYFETDEMTIDLTGIVADLYITTPILKGIAHSTLPETLPFPYSIGVYDRIGVFAEGSFDNPEILFAYPDFSSSVSIGADLTNGYLWVNWDWCAQDDDTYNLGLQTLRWKDGNFSGTVYTDYVDATSGYKVNGTSPVADGTYTVGKGSTQDGTITITGGIITAVQEASN